MSISKVLQVQSEQLRIERRQRAEEMAAKAPIKMLFPLVGCIFPSLFIVILGPAIILIMQNLDGLDPGVAIAAARVARRPESHPRPRARGDALESADGLWGKFMGLMGRPSLPAGAALWLPESNGIHMMFMRFPIDAVFVGKADPAREGARPVLVRARAAAGLARASCRWSAARTACWSCRSARSPERHGRRRPDRARGRDRASTAVADRRIEARA